MRYTPSSKRAASDMECDELAIFTTQKTRDDDTQTGATRWRQR